MSTVDDFPIANRNEFLIIKEQNGNYILAEAWFYNEQPLRYDPIIEESVTGTFQTPYEIQKHLMTLCGDIFGWKTVINFQQLQYPENRIIDSNEFKQARETNNVTEPNGMDT